MPQCQALFIEFVSNIKYFIITVSSHSYLAQVETEALNLFELVNTKGRLKVIYPQPFFVSAPEIKS